MILTPSGRRWQAAGTRVAPHASRIASPSGLAHPRRCAGDACARSTAPRLRAPGAQSSGSGGPSPARPPVDIFSAVPEATAGRKRWAALLLASAALEVTVTGGLVWAPIACALALIATRPTHRQQREREEAVVARAVARARAEMAARVPATPVESAAWLERLNAALWQPYWQPLLLRSNLTQWQDNIANAAPRGWDVEIVDLSLGRVAPRVSAFQAFVSPSDGQLAGVECAVSFRAEELLAVVRGRGPLGQFTVRASALSVEGALRVTPVLDQRMLLWAFKEPPEVAVKLAVQGPIGGAAYDVSQFAFIQDLLASRIEEALVEPRRGVLSLDYDLAVEEAVATTVRVGVESVRALGAPPRTSRRTPPLLTVVAVNASTQMRAATRPRALGTRRSLEVGEVLSVDFPSKDGIVLLEVRDASRAGALLGAARVCVAAARDGSTLLWGADRTGAPLARRLWPRERAWRVALPLEGAAGGELLVSVGVAPWVYKQPTAVPAYRSSGPRTVLVQLVEAVDLLPPAAAEGSAVQLQLQYSGGTYATSAVVGAASPVWLQTFALEENPSMLTRRIRLEAWARPVRGAAPADAAPSAAANGNGRGATAAAAAPLGIGVGSGTVGQVQLLGVAVLNLDLPTENLVQDRWYSLGGGGSGAQVRVRMALVGGDPSCDAVRQALALVGGALAGAAREALTVEVVVARLDLPLSSVDSADGDAHPLLALSYGGATVVCDPDAEDTVPLLSTDELATPALACGDGDRARARAAFAYAAAPAGGGEGGVLRIRALEPTGVVGSEDWGALAVDVPTRLGDGASWEGWQVLDKDCGVLLVRLARLPASAPADVALPLAAVEPPPWAGLDEDDPPEEELGPAKAAAAAAVADGRGASGGRDAVSNALERLDLQLMDVLSAGLQQAVDQVKDLSSQVSGFGAQTGAWLGSLRGGETDNGGASGALGWVRPPVPPEGAQRSLGQGMKQLLDARWLLPVQQQQHQQQQQQEQEQQQPQPPASQAPASESSARGTDAGVEGARGSAGAAESQSTTVSNGAAAKAVPRDARRALSPGRSPRRQSAGGAALQRVVQQLAWPSSKRKAGGGAWLGGNGGGTRSPAGRSVSSADGGDGAGAADAAPASRSDDAAPAQRDADEARAADTGAAGPRPLPQTASPPPLRSSAPNLGPRNGSRASPPSRTPAAAADGARAPQRSTVQDAAAAAAAAAGFVLGSAAWRPSGVAQPPAQPADAALVVWDSDDWEYEDDSASSSSDGGDAAVTSSHMVVGSSAPQGAVSGAVDQGGAPPSGGSGSKGGASSGAVGDTAVPPPPPGPRSFSLSDVDEF